MKIKDYSIIETEWVETELLKNQKEIKSYCHGEDENKYYQHFAKIELLKEIKSKLKPLIPITEQSFDKGRDYQKDFGVINSKENYINNTIIK